VTRFLLSAFSFVLCFAALEALCRWTELGQTGSAYWQEDRSTGTWSVPSGAGGSSLGFAGWPVYQPEGRLVYRYSDNPRGYFDRNNEVIGSINAYGYRGRQHDRDKPEGVTRIAFLGDSFTLGIGVRDDDTLPASLERAARGAGYSVESLNFGITASNTQLQLRALREYVLRFEPDVVVIVMFLNDAKLRGTVGYLSRAKYLRGVREHSYFANALIGTIERRLGHDKLIQYYRDGYNPESPGWLAMQASLAEAHSLARRKNFELVAALYPVLIDLEGPYPFDEIHRTIGGFVRSIDVHYVDLLPAFRGHRDEELWVHASDQHPNEVAHEKAAKALLSFLDERGLIGLRAR